jgi:hypothetical protein
MKRATIDSNRRTRAGRRLAGACAVALAGYAGCAAAGPTIPFGKEGSLTFNYSFQGWAQDRGFTSPTDEGRTTDFFLRRNRLTFSGQFNDLVGFYANLDAPNEGKNGQNDKSIFFRDAYVTVDPSDSVRFMAGRFKNSFTRENLEACFDPLTMDRAEVMSYTPWGGSRDTGVAVWGNLADGKAQYRLMFANGRDGNEVVKKSPRVTARVHLSLLDPEYDYGYRGTYLGTRNVLTIGASYDYQPDVAYLNYVAKTDPVDYKGWTADIFYEQPTSVGTFTASAAVIRLDTGKVHLGASPDPNLPLTTDTDGWYAKAGYLLPGKVGPGRVQFFGRHERSQYSLPYNYGDQKWDGIGVHYLLDGQLLKLSFEAAQVKFDVQNPTDASQRDYKQYTLGLQFIF